jgi:hypothetical protein
MDEDTGCGVCGEVIRQSSPPELRYIVNKETGKGANVQCCIKCFRELKEMKAPKDEHKEGEQRLDDLQRKIREAEERLNKINSNELLIPKKPLPAKPAEPKIKEPEVEIPKPKALEKIAEVKATAKPKQRRKRRKNARLKDVV